VLNYGIFENSKYMISGGQDKNLILWDIEKEEEIFRLDEDITQSTIMTVGVDNKNNLVSFSGKNKYFKILGSSGVIQIWDLFKKELYCELTEHKGAVTALIHYNNFIYSSGKF
jgi:WD40 repeat protein